MSIHDGSSQWEWNQTEQGFNACWPDRYRPKTLAEMALDPKIRALIETYFASGEMRALALFGPPGTGKTTLADIIVRHLFPTRQKDHVVRINASQMRSIDVIRDEVIPWVRSQGGILRMIDKDPVWRCAVLFSEADGLTAEAQDALKDAMDAYSSSAVFIFTTNTLGKLNGAIQSRCKKIELGPPPVPERARVLGDILRTEGLPEMADVALTFASRFDDMRTMLREAQDSIAVHGALVSAIDEDSAAVWPEPVDGNELLGVLCRTFEQHLSLPEGAPVALALWTVFAHAHEAFRYSPILAVTSPVKRSGKTRLFELLSLLVPNPVFASSITPAAVYRMGGVVPDSAPTAEPVWRLPTLTLLADEGDTWLRLRPELQGVLNSGHTRRAAFVIRVLRDGPAKLSTWYPKALALIDRGVSDLPPTVQDRSIIIPMRRKKREEAFLALRDDADQGEIGDLRQKTTRWVHDQFEALRAIEPTMPTGIGDRAADNWRALISIAQLISPEWAERARKACRTLSGALDEAEETIVLLLGDIREVFADDDDGRVPTGALLHKLSQIQDRPWRTTLDPFKLAQYLRPFNIKPKALWIMPSGRTGKALRGYQKADFTEAFDRYLSRG